MGVNREALQLHAVNKKPYFLVQVTWESVSVLEVTWKTHISTYYKSCENLYPVVQVTHCIWTCNEIEGPYDKITIVPSCTGLVCCLWHCYSCCSFVTIQTATIFQYSLVQWWYKNIYKYTMRGMYTTACSLYILYITEQLTYLTSSEVPLNSLMASCITLVASC